MNNKTVKRIKLISFLAVALMVALVAIYNIAFATEEVNLEATTTEVGTEEVVSGVVRGDRTIATYSHYGAQGGAGSALSSIVDINGLINTMNDKNANANNILMYYASVFCLKHNVGLPTYKTDLDRIVNSDFDVSSYITLNYDAHTAYLSPTKFSDYRQNGTSETRTTKSNMTWKAFETNIKHIETPYNTFDTNAILYAVTFSAKNYKNEAGTEYLYLGTEYKHERAQDAVWSVTGDATSDLTSYLYNDLYKAGKALDSYEAEAGTHGSSPTVSVGPECGTVLLGNNASNYQYKIGPFNMSDYAYLYTSYAEGYSGGLMGGINAGLLTLNNGTTIAIDGSSCKIEYSNTGDNNRSGENWWAPANYKFPWPNSTFYIVVNKSLCGDATTLSKIKFTYQSTRADGYGWVLKSKYVQTSWKMVDGATASGVTYYCPVTWGSHECTGSSTSANSGDSRTCTANCDASKNYCVHSVWNGHHTDTCPRCTCDGKDKWVTTYTTDKDGNKVASGGYWKCTHSHKYCSTGYCSQGYYHGNHTPSDHTSTYHSKTYSYYKNSEGVWTYSSDWRSNGWTWVETFNWEGTPEVKYGQPLLAVNRAQVFVEEKDFEVTVDVRLTTNVSIDKYITKVDHVAETGTIYGENEDRKDKDTNWKNTNSVKSERGDRITWKVVLTNHQNEEVKFKIRDILPSNYAYTINPSIGDWLVIPASGKKEITITTDVEDKTGTHNNTALIITRNKGNSGNDSVDYPRTTSRSGPVVNIAELEGKKLQDADYFTIKEYNVSVDKNIVEVKHVANDEVVYSGNSRKNIDENSKKSSPVYVEYGDKVTYEIDIYNTTTPYEANRNGSPYWDPDKVYVDISDTLPKKYSNLTVSVSNSTGTIGTLKTSSTNGGSFRIDDIVVPKNDKVTVTVTLVVEEHNKDTQEENKLEIVGDILNINKKEIKNNPGKKTTSDYYHLNDYNMSINKYIDEYDHKMTDQNNSNKFTNETVNFTDRSGMTEAEKSNKPLAVEKTETVRYAIRLDNNAVTEQKALASGVKRATSVRPTDVTDVLDYGLTYKSVFAKVYKADGSDKYGNLPVSVSSLGNNTYRFSVPNKASNGSILIVDPGEYLIYYMTVQVTETNMYLYKLSNMAILTTLTDINHTDSISRVVKNDQYNENIAPIQTTQDFVKLKDLVIAGKVWLDSDKDGYMGKNASGVLNSFIDHEADPSSNITAPSGDSEYAMKGIVVKLYDANNPDTPVRTTKTDETGLFTFAKDANGNWYSGTYSYDGAVTESEQRVPKATNKDGNKNYTTNSEYIEYYIEYEYDGLVYKSTEVYSGTKNLQNDGSLVSGDKYKIDSNAKELKNVRDAFDLKYEVMGYNKAYNADLSTEQNISYEKSGHNSYLMVDHTRVMTARSFIVETDAATLANNCRIAMNNCGAGKWKSCVNHWKNWQGLIESGYFDESQFANTTQGRLEAQAYLKRLYNEVIKNLSNDGNTQITKYLWLFKPAVEVDKPETEYLKYINLGLEEREDIDISVVQDVYEVKTTVNGEEMTYFYNQNKFALDGSSVDHAGNLNEEQSKNYTAQFYMTRKDTESNNDNVAISPYQFKYYTEDLSYRVDQYNIETVREYKTKDSELNSEIKFRIIVTNNSITNDEPHKSVKDIPVYAGINEVIEYFDEKFADIQYNDDGTVKTINVKTKDEDGYLVDTPYKIADAYFVLPNGTTIPATISGYNTSNEVKVISSTSKYNQDPESAQIKDNVEKAGYHTIYIRPNVDTVSKVILAEGENVDIIVKFTVDKPNRDSNNTADRALKLGLKTAVAEVGAYSTYYKNADGSYYAAGLVDKDSNPGNFGQTYNGVKLDKDKNNKANDPYLALYEDDTYKSGIDDSPIPGAPKPPYRYISGLVWDDARSEIATKADGTSTEDGVQYIGDGKNGVVDTSANKTAYKDASGNILPKLNKVLKNSDNTLKEEKDFLVNDVGVTLVEQIRVPVYDASGNFVEERTYEDTIKANPSSVVSTRTGENGAGEGKYGFAGFIPGEYVVRFTYGDSTSDQMAIFNGQDYKSTTYQAGSQYAENVYQTKDDGRIIRDYASAQRVRDILTAPGISDAKDDEIRRLETISYSETLNNNKTLILRGINSTNKELQSDRTSMKSDTAEFLVRTEQEIETNKLPFSIMISRFAQEDRLKIPNVDFGLQYRPEQQVALNKFVKNLTITTADKVSGAKENLVDAKFNEYYGLVVNTDSETGITTYLGYRTEDGSSEFETLRIPAEYVTGNVTDINNYVNDLLSANEMTTRDLNASLNDCKKNQDGTYQVIIAGTELDTVNSIGLSNLQYVPNDGDTHDITSVQGFVYLNIDDEIMQGAEINIQYLFTGHNLSEIDRVNRNLSVLRLKGNAEVNSYTNGITDEGYNAIKVDAMRAGGTLGAISLVTTTNSYGEEADYSGALTARNSLFNEYYRYEVTSTDPNTAEAKKKTVSDGAGGFTATNEDVIYRVKAKTIGDTADDYYGRYLGSLYYTGSVGANDIVAELKLDKILDYVDNNLVFRQDQNSANDLDHFWSSTTASELVLGGYVNPSILEFGDVATLMAADEDTVKDAVEIIQRYNNKAKLEEYLSSDAALAAIKGYTDLLDEGTLVDSEGVAYNTAERSNLAILQDVRTSDAQTDIANADITKFLTPRDSKDENSYGSVKIVTSKVIAAEDDTADMSYENVGEIVEYSSVTGRVTSLSTTLGNVDLSAPSSNPNSPEYEQNRDKESDTAAVEKITLTPPTGLTRTSRILKTAVKGASYVGIVIAVIAIIVFGTFGGIKLYRKRRIK